MFYFYRLMAYQDFDTPAGAQFFQKQDGCNPA